VSTQCRTHRNVGRIFRGIAAAILLQTLWFKFTGAPESKFIFSTLGAEPWGRIGTGVIELVAAALLLRSRTAVLGAILSAGLMSGAILGHLTRLGIVVQGDGGLLFALAITVFGSSVITLCIFRQDIPFVGKFLAPACSLPDPGLADSMDSVRKEQP
jgi:hypothetical protein